MMCVKARGALAATMACRRRFAGLPHDAEHPGPACPIHRRWRPPLPEGDARGLSSAEAAARLRRDGPNRLAQAPRRGLRAIAVGLATQPMFLLLLATAAVYGVVGSLADAAVLLASVAVVGGITLVQELRTERVLDTLKELSSPRARVVRDGQVQHIPSQALVRGDRLLVSEGDRMACDAVLEVAHGLMVDESLLSGESAPVFKSAAHPLHAGTLVVGGDGVATVGATGAGTALGRIGGALASIERRPSRVQAELKRVVVRVAVFAAAASAGAALLYAARQGSWLEGLLAGLTLAMAIIPEEFAVVWTVMLALGAWRLARLGVLTRQAQAIEALGTTTVLCVDKTGTLTHNRMALVALATPEHGTCLLAEGAVPAPYHPLLRAAAAATAWPPAGPGSRICGAVAPARCWRPRVRPRRCCACA
jgi:P-type Ca2+ transporter type 2C